MPNLAEEYEARRSALDELCANVERLVRDELRTFVHPTHVDHVAFRVKTLKSFIEKVERKDGSYTNPLTEVEDQVGGRVVVFYKHDVALVHELLGRAAITPLGREHKGPRNYDDFGYEDEHVSFAVPITCEPAIWRAMESAPQVIELQVRTLQQHAWSQVAHELDYKPVGGKLDDYQRRRLAYVAASGWGSDREIELLRDEQDAAPS